MTACLNITLFCVYFVLAPNANCEPGTHGCQSICSNNVCTCQSDVGYRLSRSEQHCVGMNAGIGPHFQSHSSFSIQYLVLAVLGEKSYYFQFFLLAANSHSLITTHCDFQLSGTFLCCYPTIEHKLCRHYRSYQLRYFRMKWLHEPDLLACNLLPGALPVILYSMHTPSSR